MPPHPRNVAFLREHLWGASLGKPRPGKRVFLARSSVGTRMIVNQAAFDAALAAEGFISRDMADLSIAEQRELLSDADMRKRLTSTTDATALHSLLANWRSAEVH